MLTVTEGYARHLRSLIDIDGGFTVDLRTGRSVSRGISVCVRPSQSVVFLWPDWCDRTVSAWVRSRSLEPAWRSSHVGGWLDRRSGQVWLEEVHVVSPGLRQVAYAVGRALGQHCVFDLGRGELVVLKSNGS